MKSFQPTDKDKKWLDNDAIERKKKKSYIENQKFSEIRCILFCEEVSKFYHAG